MPTTREPDQSPLERFLDDFDDLLLYRYPHIVGPPFLAGVLLGLSAAAYWAGGGWPTLLTVLAAVVVFLGLDSVADLPGPREQTYALSCWFGGGGWVVAAAWFGPFTGRLPLVPWHIPPLLAVWALLLAAGWPPWAKHRRIRRSVDVAAQIAAWDGDAVGLPGVDLLTAGSKADADGWEAPLVPEVAGRYTLDKLRKAIPNIAARFGAATHEISIDKVRGDREGKYLLRYRRAKQRAPVDYVAPAERPTARKPFQIGVVSADRTTPLMAEFWRKGHGGVDGASVGQKGYGKTIWAKRMALHAIACRDALVMIGDMKPGSPDYHDLGGRGAYVYAMTAAEIDLMIRALLTLCRVRGERPRKDRSVILVLLDETALYFAPTPPGGEQNAVDKARAQNIDVQRKANFESLMAVSRAYEMGIYGITQRGRDTKLGGDARAAMLAGQVIGFYSPKAADSALLSSDREFQLETLPKGVPGECLISNGLHPDVTRGTLWNVTEATERDMLDRFASGQTPLQPDELRALEDEFGEAWTALRQANRRQPLPVADDENVAEPAPAAAPAPRIMTRDESQQVVWEALAGLGKPSMTRDVAARLGKSDEIVRVRLNELVEQGRAGREGHGRWIKYTAVTVVQTEPNEAKSAAQ